MIDQKKLSFIKAAIFLLLILLAVLGMFSGSNEPVIEYLRGSSIESYLLDLHSENSIIFNLCVGFLTSTFFWLILVYFPERRSKLIIRDNLFHRYKDFKEEIIDILLSVSVGSYDSELLQQLCDHRKFREFFCVNEKEYWYLAINGLENKKQYSNDLLVELELFASEVSYVLNNVNVQDPEVHSFFKRLNGIIYRLKNSSNYSDERFKYLSGFLWEIFTRWNIIDGQLENDVIEDMINRL